MKIVLWSDDKRLQDMIAELSGVEAFVCSDIKRLVPIVKDFEGQRALVFIDPATSESEAESTCKELKQLENVSLVLLIEEGELHNSSNPPFQQLSPAAYLEKNLDKKYLEDFIDDFKLFEVAEQQSTDEVRTPQSEADREYSPEVLALLAEHGVIVSEAECTDRKLFDANNSLNQAIQKKFDMVFADKGELSDKQKPNQKGVRGGGDLELTMDDDEGDEEETLAADTESLPTGQSEDQTYAAVSVDSISLDINEEGEDDNQQVSLEEESLDQNREKNEEKPIDEDDMKNKKMDDGLEFSIPDEANEQDSLSESDEGTDEILADDSSEKLSTEDKEKSEEDVLEGLEFGAHSQEGMAETPQSDTSESEEPDKFEDANDNSDLSFTMTGLDELNNDAENEDLVAAEEESKAEAQELDSEQTGTGSEPPIGDDVDVSAQVPEGTLSLSDNESMEDFEIENAERPAAKAQNDNLDDVDETGQLQYSEEESEEKPEEEANEHESDLAEMEFSSGEAEAEGRTEGEEELEFGDSTDEVESESTGDFNMEEVLEATDTDMSEVPEQDEATRATQVANLSLTAELRQSALDSGEEQNNLADMVEEDDTTASDLFNADKRTRESLGLSSEQESEEYGTETDVEQALSQEGSTQQTKVSGGQGLKITPSQERLPEAFQEEEMARLQSTIRQLREERDALLVDIDEHKNDKKLVGQENLGLRAELEEAKIEINILRKRHADEIDEMQYRLRVSDEKKAVYEEKSKHYQRELERLGQKVRIDFNKVKQREKELESKLELTTMDSESQVRSRDTKILELKRKIDQLEFNMENAHIREQKYREDKVKLEERLTKIMKTLRGSIKILENDLDFDEELLEKIKKM